MKSVLIKTVFTVLALLMISVTQASAQFDPNCPNVTATTLSGRVTHRMERYKGIPGVAMIAFTNAPDYEEHIVYTDRGGYFVFSGLRPCTSYWLGPYPPGHPTGYNDRFQGFTPGILSAGTNSDYISGLDFQGW